jgi:hypothetical protein
MIRRHLSSLECLPTSSLSVDPTDHVILKTMVGNEDCGVFACVDSFTTTEKLSAGIPGRVAGVSTSSCAVRRDGGSA